MCFNACKTALKASGTRYVHSILLIIALDILYGLCLKLPNVCLSIYLSVYLPIYLSLPILLPNDFSSMLDITVTE